MEQNLSKELTRLVDKSVSTLGRVIADELGEKGFARIENIRRFVKSKEGQSLEGLLKLKADLRKLSGSDRYAVAHAFSLMLELINSCETAYRASRLRETFTAEYSPTKTYGRVIHVLTAHPTESRNPDIIYYFRKIQELLERALQKPTDSDWQELYVLLRWTWLIPMSKQKKPSVMDEAEYIYSLALHKDVINLYVAQAKNKQPFYLRTWVGGDKDGHPGVDERAMLGSLQMSRKFLFVWAQEHLQNYLKDLEPLSRSAHEKHKELTSLLQLSKALKQHLGKLKRLQKGDGQSLQSCKETLEKVLSGYKKLFGVESVPLAELRGLFKVFPGLVVPLELREDSGLVHAAVTKVRTNFAISRMLKNLALLSPHHDPRFYVRGFILSQCESAADIAAGVKLVEKYLGKAKLPVVPLFESAHSLHDCVGIVEEFLKSSARINMVKNLWSGKFEVMLGYSDSAKENGSFPSRFLICSAVRGIEKAIQKKQLQPIFFHGSGGSIERGGGSVQEQIEWWPSSALETVKVTVQGEMIYRNYSAPEVLRRQLQRFAAARDLQSTKKNSQEPLNADLLRMSEFIQKSYQSMVQDPHFLELIETATPYSFIKDLRMGSRPSKRQGAVKLKSLRAIPWVLCWTQTRALFPSWWGVGSFWAQLSKDEKAKYQNVFKDSSLFRSYVKVLGFTLEKIDLNVFALYLRSSPLPKDVADSFIRQFQTEFAACQKAVRDITGEKSMLWYRPWLETSIHLRSPLINPLNVLQLLALEDRDIPLLRETVTGVASGMLTTG
ncbi:MAG: phosphoenolpyruvate carboxylase [Bdellovibrio sp.]|nr:phosphoenolpyruvate carboxylase [Bdellovibrio sp.]